MLPNGTNTLLIVLEPIIKKLKIKTVLEFGCGYGTTPFFGELVESVTSIEMQNDEWYHKVKEKCNNEKHDIYLLLGSTGGIEFMKNENKRYDLILVDGHGSSRPEVINEAVNFSDIIVVHDTEAPCYGWNRVNKNLDGWVWKDIFHHVNGYGKIGTSIFTNRKDVLDII